MVVVYESIVFFGMFVVVLNVLRDKIDSIK